MENKAKDEERRNNRLICFLKHANEHSLTINPVILGNLIKTIETSEQANTELTGLIQANKMITSRAVGEKTVSLLPFNSLMMLLKTQKFHATFSSAEARQTAIRQGLIDGIQTFNQQTTDTSQELAKLLEIGKSHNSLDIQTLITLMATLQSLKDHLATLHRNAEAQVKSLTQSARTQLQFHSTKNDGIHSSSLSQSEPSAPTTPAPAPPVVTAPTYQPPMSHTNTPFSDTPTEWTHFVSGPGESSTQPIAHAQAPADQSNMPTVPTNKHPLTPTQPGKQPKK